MTSADIDHPSGACHLSAETPERLIAELEHLRWRAVLFGLDGAQTLLDVIIAGLRGGGGVKFSHAKILRDAAARACRFPGTALDEIYRGGSLAIDEASALATSSRRTG